VHRFDSGVLKRLGDSHSELHHLINRGLWSGRLNVANQAGGYLRSDQRAQFNG
jgi:hypothetical protein